MFGLFFLLTTHLGKHKLYNLGKVPIYKNSVLSSCFMGIQVIFLLFVMPLDHIHP